MLPFGGADYFGSSPGGIALGQATLRAVIADILAGLLRQRLTRLVIINGHVGNVQAIHDTTQPIWCERKLLIPSLYLWRIVYGLLPGEQRLASKLRHPLCASRPITQLTKQPDAGRVKPSKEPRP